jgi:hypothetical protein
MRAYLRSDLGFERLHGAGITSRRLAVTHDPTGFWFETVVLQNSFADLLIGGEVATPVAGGPVTIVSKRWRVRCAPDGPRSPVPLPRSDGRTEARGLGKARDLGHQGRLHIHHRIACSSLA